MPYLEHQPIDFFPRCLLQDEIANPRLAIQRVFEEEINLMEARKYLEKWLVAIFYDKPVLDRNALMVLMGLQEMLLKLLEAAHLLQMEDPALREEIAITVMKGIGLPVPALYCGVMHKHSYTAWDYFPRHLNRKEFANPYRVFYKLCQYKRLPEWRNTLQHFFSGAVAGGPVYTYFEDENIYLTCKLLLKLVEAAHLVKVREGKAGKD
jgi:hypothetical protein